MLFYICTIIIRKGNSAMKEIFHRTSIRNYQDKPVETEKIEKMLRAAMAAPSAGNQQPWEFYVVTDKDALKKLAKTYLCYGATFLLSTGLLFLEVEILHWSAVISPVLNLLITIPLNFLLNKFWAFQ